jgi:tetratricopeptide (TPR) repeat protein
MAEAAFREAIRFAPYWPYPWHNLALVSTQRGNYDAAIAQYQQAIAIEPTYSYLPYNLGLLYQRINRRGDAETSYRDALRLATNARAAGILNDPDGRKPQESAAGNALGAVAADKKRWKDAESDYCAAIAADPLNPVPRHNLAVLLTRDKRVSPVAESLWKGIIGKDPLHLPARLALARYYVETGRAPEGVQTYRDLLERYKDFELARRELASALLKTGDPAGALAELLQVPNVASEDAALFERIGDAEAATKDDRTKNEALHRALALVQAPAHNRDEKRISGKLGE